VAGHTKALTLTYDDVMDHPAVELEKLLTFSGYNVKSRRVIDKPALELKKRLQERFPLYSNISLAMQLHDGNGSRWCLTKELFVEAVQVGVNAINEEMNQTNNLTE
jgi:hypothetical protein